MKEITSIPNAPKTFEAIRSLGYDLNSSIADIVDNSITEKVGAKKVLIDFLLDRKNDLSCRVQDDGCGMSDAQLLEAMRVGTETTYEDNDLGKFGMGMKSASLSHCNILTVISKRKNSELCGYRWDMGHVKKREDWTLLKLSSQEIHQILKDHQIELFSYGTIVFWNDLHFLNKEYNSFTSEKLAQNFYYRIVESLKLHLRMVFHRFLDGSVKNGQIQLKVNGSPLSPWNPFFPEEENTEEIHLKKELSEFKIKGYKCPVYIGAYVLPSKEGFSSEDAWKDAKGLLSWNDSQGYYIYRADRIIRYGGWHGTKAKDEHDKLARVSIDIDTSLDELFRITVNKTKVQFPEILYQHLKNVVNPVIVKKAKAKYNKSEEVVTVNNKFRRNSLNVSNISKELLSNNQIKTKNTKTGSSVEVVNPSGTWLSNKISEFLKYGTDKDYEIVSAPLQDNKLWKIVCNHNDKFKVIINTRHPFYSKVYKSASSRSATNALDAFIFSLAFAELYNRNDQNAQLFDTFKTVCSKALEKLIKAEIV